MKKMTIQQVFACSIQLTEQGPILGSQKLQVTLLTTQVGKCIQGIKASIKQYIDLNKEPDDISCLVMDCQ